MARIEVTNPYDWTRSKLGEIPAAEVRRIELEALVDTGARTLALPEEVVEFLGLLVHDERRVRLANGQLVDVPVVGARVEILGRDAQCDAYVLPRGTKPLVGQVPLELCDLVVIPGTNELRPNPENPDAPVFDLLAVTHGTV